MLLASCVIKKEQDAAPAFLHIRSYEKYKVKLSLNRARGRLTNDPSANLPLVFVSKSSFILRIPERTLYFEWVNPDPLCMALLTNSFKTENVKF